MAARVRVGSPALGGVWLIRRIIDMREEGEDAPVRCRALRSARRRRNGGAG